MNHETIVQKVEFQALILLVKLGIISSDAIKSVINKYFEIKKRQICETFGLN